MHDDTEARARPAADLQPGLARNAACVLGLCMLAGFAALFVLAPAVYFKLLPLFFYFDNPHPAPFGDLRAVMTSIDCWQKGLHGYAGSSTATGGCLGFNYSPVWLRLPFLATSQLDVTLAALLLAGAFLWSLRLLPLQRTRRGLLLMLLATASSTCVFAIERANVDVLLYLFCFGGALLLGRRWPGRAWAYLLFGVAALLKFYPVVLLGLAVRERLPRALLVLGITLLAAAAFALAYHEEMRLVLTGVAGLNTHWGPFSDRFGARQMADGLWLLMASDAVPTAVALLPGNDKDNPKPPAWAVAALVVLALVVAIAAWRRSDFQPRWQTLSRSEADFLMVGAVIVAGCFFAGYNIMYRAIFVLLALPGLIALGRAGGGVFWGWLPAAVVYNLWAPTIQHLIQYGAKLSGQLQPARVLMLADWLAHEIAWWWAMAAFIVVMLQLASQALPRLRRS